MTQTSRVWSRLGTVGRALLISCSALTAVACGRTAKNGNQHEPDGKAGASGNVASAGRGGTSQSGTSSLGGAGGTAGGLLVGGSGSIAGASGGASPEESAAWKWEACGSLEPIEGQVTALAYTADGDDLAVAYEDGRALLYTESAREPKRVLRSSGAPLHAITFSLDGTYYAGSGGDFVRFIHVQRLAEDEQSPLDLQDCPTTNVRFSAESDRLVAWDNRALCIWHLADGTLLHQLTGQFTSAALKGNRLLVAEGSDGSSPAAVKAITLPGLLALSVAVEPLPGGDETGAFEVSPRGDTFASALLSPFMRRGGLWSAEGRLLAATEGLLLGYSLDGALAAIGDQVLDAQTGESVGGIPSDWSPRTEPVVINSSATRIAEVRWARSDGAVGLVHELPTGHQIRVHGLSTTRTPLRDLAISEDGRRLAVGTDMAMVWSIPPEFADSQQRAIAHSEVLHDVDFSATSELFVSGDGWVMHSAEGTRVVERAVPDPQVLEPNCMLTTLRASPENQWLAIGQYNRSLQIRARETAQLVATVNTPACNARAAFSSDEQYLATTGPTLYRTRDWTRLWPPLESDAPPSSDIGMVGDLYQDVAFLSGDTELLVSHCGSQPGPMTCRYELRSVTDGALIRELPQLGAHRASVSPESHWIVAGNVLLHLPTDTVRTLEPAPTLAVFAPEGDIIGASDDGSLTRYCRAR